MTPRKTAAIQEGTIGKQAIGFSIAGLVALLIDLSVFNLLLAVDVNPSLGNLIAGATALVMNFAVNFHTFKDKNSPRKSITSLSRFSVVVVASTLYIYGLFEIFLLVTPSTDETILTLARIVIIGSSTIARFFLYRRWVF